MTYQLMLKLPIGHILRGAILRGFVETSHMPLHVGGDFFNFFTFIAYNNHYSLAMVNPQTDFLLHKGLLTYVWPHLLS
jgi:hypothetical protein